MNLTSVVRDVLPQWAKNSRGNSGETAEIADSESRLGFNTAVERSIATLSYPKATQYTVY